MLGQDTVRLLAFVVLAGTVAGGILLGMTLRRPRERGPVVAKREPAMWAEVVWPIVIAVSQLWSVGVLLLPGWFYAWPAVGEFPGPEVVQTAGLVLWAAGGGLVVWSLRVLGAYMTPSIQVTRGHRLVREGPYARMRHPTYTANIAVAVGLGLLFLSPPLLLVAVLMAATALHRVGIEEALLRSPEGFGAEYEVYASTTGRFLLRITRRDGR